MKDFLPLSRDEMKNRGWDQLDFICITGDAYVDHPSFGIAVISRLLEAEGYRVGIISRPDRRSAVDFKRLGRPRLAFLVTAGNMDSMVSNYTVAKRRRRRDVYAPGGGLSPKGDSPEASTANPGVQPPARPGADPGDRPNRASIVYSIRAREAYKGVPIVMGGLEASLRRLAHYDYWDNKVRRSVLLDAKADILVYGMGENQIREIARRLEGGEDLSGIPGTVIPAGNLPPDWDGILLPSFEESSQDPAAYAGSFKIQYDNTDPFHGRPLAEPYGEGPASRYVIQNPPSPPLSPEELDRVFDLPYTRTYHPSYEAAGGVPAVEEVRFSIIGSRGCFGSCSFCALTFHQGRIVQGRGRESILREGREIIESPNFKGYIHDLGGPTANFRQAACAKQLKSGSCRHRECLYPRPCPNLELDHGEYLEILRELRALPGVKKVFIRSGIRFDYLMADPDRAFFTELCAHHISGQLKVAPEHISPPVLAAMGMPSPEVYRSFEKRYQGENRRLKKKQFLIPYFISSHPGSDLGDAIALAEYFRDRRFIPQQVQDFYPTPGTLATCMYHTGIDPRTGRPIYVARDSRDKAMQRALMHFQKRENHDLVREALKKAGRDDLIGYGPQCLVPPSGSRRPGRSKRPGSPGAPRGSGAPRAARAGRRKTKNRRKRKPSP